VSYYKLSIAVRMYYSAGARAAGKMGRRGAFCGRIASSGFE
jgi:hypothetical protein